MAGSVSKMQAAARKIDEAKPGYDQNQRWTFYDKGKVIPRKECDCSSVCGAIAQMGGYPVDLTGTFYTGNFNAKLKAAGFREIPFKKVSDVRVGDFINAPGKHVEFAYSKDKWYSARNDEKGGSTGGTTGDQGGKENVGWGKPYDMTRGGSRKAWILRPPAAATPPSNVVSGTKDAAFRFGQANLQAERFGGIDDDSLRRGEFLSSKLGCSVYALSEVSERARNATRTALGGRDRWKTFPVGYVAVVWDSTKWDYTGHDEVTFGTDYHGAVRAELKHRSNGRRMDVVAIHVRPNASFTGTDAEKLKKKQEDIRKGLALVRKGVPTVFAGDFNTSTAEKVILPAGFIRATPNVDTGDAAGDQKLDAVFITPDLVKRDHALVDAGSVSDHKCWVYNGTLKGSTATL